MSITIPDDSAGGRFARIIVPILFILGGFGVIYWFRTQGAPAPGFAGIVPYLVGAGFILSGLGSFYSGYRARRAAEEARRLLETHRDAPWRARPGWRETELVAAPPVDRSFVTLTVFWNLFSWPFAFLLLSTPQEGPAWLVGLFPLVGLGMLAKVFADYRRGTRFGRTTLVLDPSPPRLGQAFRGTLRAERGGDADFAKGVLLKVSCYRQYVRRTRDSDGDRRRTVERDLLWRDESRIPVSSGAGGLEVPFSFELPEDMPPSNPLELKTRILWEVSAQAELPGLDLDTKVEIPVFPPDAGTAPSDVERRVAPAEGSATAGDSVASVGSGEGEGGPPSGPYVAPVTEGIELVESPGAFELHFTAARNRKGAFILGVSGVIAAALGVFVLASSSLLWGLGLVAVAALLLYGSVQQATNDTALHVRDGVIEVTHDGIGMPADVTFPASNLEAVQVHLDSGSGSNRGYSISLVAASNEGLGELEHQAYRAADVLSRMGVGEDHPAMDALLENADRPRVLLASQLVDKEEADWLAHKIREAARREAKG